MMVLVKLKKDDRIEARLARSPAALALASAGGSSGDDALMRRVCSSMEPDGVVGGMSDGSSLSKTMRRDNDDDDGDEATDSCS